MLLIGIRSIDYNHFDGRWMQFSIYIRLLEKAWLLLSFIAYMSFWRLYPFTDENCVCEWFVNSGYFEFNNLGACIFLWCCLFINNDSIEFIPSKLIFSYLYNVIIQISDPKSLWWKTGSQIRVHEVIFNSGYLNRVFLVHVSQTSLNLELLALYQDLQQTPTVAYHPMQHFLQRKKMQLVPPLLCASTWETWFRLSARVNT